MATKKLWKNLCRAPVHISDVGAILRNFPQLPLPLTSPCCDHKTPSSPQGSVQRSPRVLLSWPKLLLWIRGSVGMGVCEGAGLSPWQQASSAHNCSSIHNLIMTFTLSIWRQSLTAAACRWTHTLYALLAGAKTVFFFWFITLGNATSPSKRCGFMLCNRGALKSPCLCSTVCNCLIFLKPPVLFVQLLKPHTITLLFFFKSTRTRWCWQGFLPSFLFQKYSVVENNWSFL